MFTMVNDARLGVALQGLSQAEVARQNAARYARERRQGRALSPGPGDEDPVAIAAHPDVRRMLLTIRAFTEAARGLGLWVALQIDIANRHPDAAVRARADRLAALLTPVIKAHFTDWGTDAANLALQCFGGYGFIRDTGVEQFVRDVRITQIYEGTNGIQALDLVRRKLTQAGGAGVREFLAMVGASVDAAQGDPVTAPLASRLGGALRSLEQATAWMQQRAGAEVVDAAGGASDYLRLFGLVSLGWVWLEYGVIAARAVSQHAADRAFYEHKLVVARFYMARILPESSVLLERATLGAADLTGIPGEDL